jgi:hypothetical protein
MVASEARSKFAAAQSAVDLPNAVRRAVGHPIKSGGDEKGIADIDA